MKWFAGSVSTAIQVSRKNNALFIVFIESKNAKGAKMSELWDKVEPSLFDCPFVGIHLMEGDEAAKQFSQIYPTPVLPVSYIIDNLGKPIEIITLLKDIDYDEFFSKLNNAVKVFIANRKATTSNGPTPESSGDQAPTTSSAQAASSSSAGLSLDEKVERAKRLLEQKKKADEEAKKQEEKERELERIHTGKLMQEAQKKREEQELIEAAAQRRRDKIEAEKERERVKAQIKADREEREFRERRGRPVDMASAGDMPAQPAAPKMEPVPSDRCRVQVRLPNGENIVEEFPSNDCLNTLTELIKQVTDMKLSSSRIIENIQDGRVGGAFSIAQVYPRKVFTDEDMEKSFLELCLTPTCTLLVLQSRPKTSQIVAASPLGGIFSLFSMLIIAPLQYIYNVIAGFLGWNSGSSLRMRAFRRFCRLTSIFKGSDASTTTQARQDEAKRQRDPHASGATVRRRGNVTRLHNTNDDSDDENANWNGNSTQFL
ncbi:hypothetical protein Aduo_010293 [Ancylostoma duodenale]